MTTVSVDRVSTKPAITVTTTLSALSARPVKTADFLSTVKTLRNRAITHFDKYVVKGRKAMLELLADIYSEYQAAVSTGEITTLVAELKENLKAEEKAVPAKASDCSVLIRYIFSTFTPKQVYVYSRTLEIASEKQTAPQSFVELIEAAGGLEKLCGNNLTSGGRSTAATAVLTAINMAKNAPTEQTIAAQNWTPTEKARIFIGIPDGPGQVKLINANLSPKSIEATLNRYRIDTEEAKKAKETKRQEAAENEAGKILITSATARQAKAHLRVLEAETELAAAQASNSKQRISTATAHLKFLKEALDEAEAELATLIKQYNPQASA